MSKAEERILGAVIAIIVVVAIFALPDVNFLWACGL